VYQLVGLVPAIADPGAPYSTVLNRHVFDDPVVASNRVWKWQRGEHDSLFTRPGNGAVVRRRSPPGRKGTTMNTNRNTSRRIAAALGAILVVFAGSAVVLGAGSASAQDCAPSTDTYNTDGYAPDGTTGDVPDDPATPADESYSVENTC
jgi:hypothetical protein